MTHYRTMYDAEFLGHWDLPENRDVVVTISDVKGGELTAQGGRKNRKPIVSFAGKEKRMVMNKTNSKAIAGMYGPHVEAWKGKKIALYVSTTRDPSTGGDTPCIRVRPKIPAASPQAHESASAPPPIEADSGLGEGGAI